jgi:CheY-like chemotaxis protein
MKVLIVDDDRAARYALSEVLSDLPAELVLAESGEEALRQVLKQEFAAILLDIRLPKMDGFEVAAAIRSLERLRPTPILFMSANEDRRKQPRIGNPDEHYYRKPLVPEVVRSTVVSILARQGSASSPPPPALDLQNSAVQDRA